MSGGSYSTLCAYEAKRRGIRFARYRGPLEHGVEVRVCIRHVWMVARIERVLEDGRVLVSRPALYGHPGERVATQVEPGALRAVSVAFSELGKAK